MATIGLDKLFYAPITEDENGDEEYGTPVMLANAMTAELSIELNEATLYADDGAAEIVKEFKSGTPFPRRRRYWRGRCRGPTGAKIDANGVLISSSENDGAPVAVGFRARKANGTYRYFWLYRVKFAVPSTNLTTKGDSIEFSTPTIEGRSRAAISWMARTSILGRPRSTRMILRWRLVISGWYTEVYEPDYTEDVA